MGGGLAVFFGGGLMIGGLFMLSSAFAKSAIGKQVAPLVGATTGQASKVASALSYEGRNSRQVNKQNKKTSKSRAKNEYESNREFIKGE